MKRKLYWGLGVLVLLLCTAFVFMTVRNRAEMRQLEKGAAEAEKLQQESDSPRQRKSTQQGDAFSSNDRPPPLGEIEGTGHWEGNVWHKTGPPKPEWKAGSDADLYSKALRDGVYLEYWELKEALRYHPESPLLLSMFAYLESLSDEPAVVIAYAKKALRNLKTTSEDYSNRAYSVTRSPRVMAHSALRHAYQRLGDYKTALVHLKMTQSLVKPALALDNIEGSIARMRYESCSREIAAIKAGKPLLGPDPKPEPAAAPVVSEPSPEPSDAGMDSEQPVDTPAVPSRFPVRPDMSSTDPSFVDKRAEAEALRDHPERVRAQQEHFDFIRWMETIETAKSPADLDTFLMREMAKTLSGGTSQFTPDRLIRAFEMMHRHGETEGLRALEKRDAVLARELSREPPKKRMPPVPPKRNNRMK